MALRSKSLNHGRSLSLPSASHSALSHFDDNLSRFRSSETTCSSLSSTNSRINGLRNLYESIHDLFLHSQQQMISEECVDGFISLLDACTSVKDIISLLKEHVRELLSAVRRKDASGINGYLVSRRNSKKMIQRSLRNLRRSSASATISERECAESMSLVSMLREAESVASSLFESLLSYTLGAKMQENKNSWSLVSKLMQSNKKASDEENEFNKLDSFLKMNQEKELVNHLKEMDSSIQVIEEDLESVFRQLIKTRVSLLNILNH